MPHFMHFSRDNFCKSNYTTFTPVACKMLGAWQGKVWRTLMFFQVGFWCFDLHFCNWCSWAPSVFLLLPYLFSCHFCWLVLCSTIFGCIINHLLVVNGADSVDTLMAENHELGGSAVVIDRATPKANSYVPLYLVV